MGGEGFGYVCGYVNGWRMEGEVFCLEGWVELDDMDFCLFCGVGRRT
jgi:hypothetical protein